MSDRRTDPSPPPEASSADSPARQRHGGYDSGDPDQDQGWTRGYGAGRAHSGYRGGVAGRAYAGGLTRSDYDRSFGGREEPVGPEDRSWLDRVADDEASGHGHHRGRGPRNWSRDDQRIYEAVCERLLHDRLIDARGVEVEVENGMVILRGEVHAAADPVLAERLVRQTPGVKDVEMDLRVRIRPPEPEPPHAAEERIDKSPMGYPILPT